MGLFEKVTFEQRPEGGKEGAMQRQDTLRCTRGLQEASVAGWVRGAKQGDEQK